MLVIVDCNEEFVKLKYHDAGCSFMMRTNSTQNDVTWLLGQIIKTLPRIKKIVKTGIPIIDGLMRAGFTETGGKSFKQQKMIELGAGGIISIYGIYKGIKQKKNYMVVQGVIIGAALTAVWISSSKKKLTKTKSYAS